MTLDYTCRPLNPPSPSSNYPYNSCLSSSASSSSSSVFSVDGAASQTSEASSSSTNSLTLNWDAEDAWSAPGRTLQQQVLTEQVSVRNPQPLARASTFPLYRRDATSQPQHVLPPLRTCDVAVPPEQRQHPRRSSTSLGVRCPPALVRQSERKVNFVDSLVDSATQMVELIWPLSVPACQSESAKNVLPLRTFIQETLRRSRTSYSTLQVALYYLVLIKSHVPSHDFTMEQPEDRQALRALQCGRRMFLAALILASKYLQDRNYSARAWSKISGLGVCEINTNELAFLQAVGWKLHIVDSIWARWQAVVLKYTPASHPPSSPGVSPTEMSWKTVIPLLTPELEIAGPSQVQQQMPLRLTATGSRTPLGVSNGSCSQEGTPTPTNCRLPRYLEPKPDMLPPTPTLARLGPLPTPMMTPQSNSCITPAAGVLNFGSRRPSMCSAMAQAQQAAMARSTMDQWNPSCKPLGGLEYYSMTARRSSLAPSVTSSASSPESMVSDNSSRSSRASSISSVSSSTMAPTQTRLARLATCRSAARLRGSAMPLTKENCDLLASDPVSSPDLDSFHLDDSDDVLSVNMDFPRASAAVNSSVTKDSKGRKRCRSSVSSIDTSLQQNVRQLLSEPLWHGPTTVLPDRSVAQSFLLADAKALQSPKYAAPECRRPVPKDLGRKRTCLASHGPSSGNIWNSLYAMTD